MNRTLCIDVASSLYGCLRGSGTGRQGERKRERKKEKEKERRKGEEKMVKGKGQGILNTRPYLHMKQRLKDAQWFEIV